MPEEKDGKTHILETLQSLAKDVAICNNPEEPKEDEAGLWDCYNCESLSNCFKFVSETAACLAAILENLIRTNPDLELGDMRDDPNNLVEKIKKEIRDIPDSLYQ